MAPRTEEIKPDIESKIVASAALGYVELGWRVVPLHSIVDGHCTCGKAECGSPGKHPIAQLAPHGVNDASGDPELVERWFRQRPWANVAIALASDLAAIDVDPRNGGTASFRNLQSSAQDYDWTQLSATPSVMTGGKGWHYYMRPPQGARALAQIGPYEGVEFKVGNMSLVAPPSLHRSGETYQWRVPPTQALIDTPAPLLSYIIRPATPPPTFSGAAIFGDLATQAQTLGGNWPQRLTRYSERAITGTLEELAQAPAGTHQMAFFKAATGLYHLSALGLVSDAEATNLLSATLTSICDKHPQREIDATLAKAREVTATRLGNETGFIRELQEAYDSHTTSSTRKPQVSTPQEPSEVTTTPDKSDGPVPPEPVLSDPPGEPSEQDPQAGGPPPWAQTESTQDPKVLSGDPPSSTVFDPFVASRLAALTEVAQALVDSGVPARRAIENVIIQAHNQYPDQLVLITQLITPTSRSHTIDATPQIRGYLKSALTDPRPDPTPDATLRVAAKHYMEAFGPAGHPPPPTPPERTNMPISQDRPTPPESVHTDPEPITPDDQTPEPQNSTDNPHVVDYDEMAKTIAHFGVALYASVFAQHGEIIDLDEVAYMAIKETSEDLRVKDALDNMVGMDNSGRLGYQALTTAVVRHITSTLAQWPTGVPAPTIATSYDEVVGLVDGPLKTQTIDEVLGQTVEIPQEDSSPREDTTPAETSIPDVSKQRMIESISRLGVAVYSDNYAHNGEIVDHDEVAELAMVMTSNDPRSRPVIDHLIGADSTLEPSHSLARRELTNVISQHVTATLNTWPAGELVPEVRVCHDEVVALADQFTGDRVVSGFPQLVWPRHERRSLIAEHDTPHVLVDYDLLIGSLVHTLDDWATSRPPVVYYNTIVDSLARAAAYVTPNWPERWAGAFGAVEQLAIAAPRVVGHLVDEAGHRAFGEQYNIWREEAAFNVLVDSVARQAKYSAGVADPDKAHLLLGRLIEDLTGDKPSHPPTIQVQGALSREWVPRLPVITTPTEHVRLDRIAQNELIYLMRFGTPTDQAVAQGQLLATGERVLRSLLGQADEDTYASGRLSIVEALGKLDMTGPAGFSTLVYHGALLLENQTTTEPLPISLDEIVERGSQLADEHTPSPQDEAETHLLVAQVESIMSTWPEEDAYIVRARTLADPIHSWADIAKEVSLSVPETRHRGAQAFQTLREQVIANCDATEAAAILVALGVSSDVADRLVLQPEPTPPQITPPLPPQVSL